MLIRLPRTSTAPLTKSIFCAQNQKQQQHTHTHTNAIESTGTRHERLVMFLGCGITEDGGCFLVTEFMDGGSLDRA